MTKKTYFKTRFKKYSNSKKGENGALKKKKIKKIRIFIK